MRREGRDELFGNARDAPHHGWSHRWWTTTARVMRCEDDGKQMLGTRPAVGFVSEGAESGMNTRWGWCRVCLGLLMTPPDVGGIYTSRDYPLVTLKCFPCQPINSHQCFSLVTPTYIPAQLGEALLIFNCASHRHNPILIALPILRPIDARHTRPATRSTIFSPAGTLLQAPVTSDQ
jgi:hypothetical protein